MSVSPSVGEFMSGSIFTATVTVDTEGEPINTFEIFLNFPPDRLQVVSPISGESIASVWVGQPKFDNRTGVVELRGGVPGGINTDRGVIANIQFRAKGVGAASLKIGDSSKILANDGAGTNVLRNKNAALYRVAIPPSAGPLVVSPTHPDQDEWYADQNVTLQWEQDPESSGYSYVLSQNSAEKPDNISEGDRTVVTYEDIASGNWFFHLKSLRDGVWGGTSHFAIHIDVEPPADFPIEVIPCELTLNDRPVIQFSTTDALSGMNHFEMRIVPLGSVASAAKATTSGRLATDSFEVVSPYISEGLPTGPYDVSIYAYDRAGNYQYASKKMQVAFGMSRFFNGRGLVLSNCSVIPWAWIIIAGILLVVLAASAVYWAHRRHASLGMSRSEQDLPEDIKTKLKELQSYRQKYSKIPVILLILLAGLWLSHSIAFAAQLAPPIITSVSENISNEEIFYVSGRSVPDSIVVLYLQNTGTGEVVSAETVSSDDGDWFYRHSSFLRAGEYIFWARAASAGETSPPGPQTKIRVETAAVEFGVSRLSYVTLYLLIAVILLVAVLALMFIFIFYVLRTKKKRQRLMMELKVTEEKICRGFAVLRKDIEAELMLLNQKDAAALLPEERSRAKELQEDIEKVSRYIGREIWELENDAVD